MGAQLMFFHPPLTKISMFPFYGWGSFQIRFARRRAHPWHEQTKVTTCSLSLFAYGEVHDSILSGGGASRSKLSRHWLGEGGWGVEPRTLREQGGGEQGVRAPKTRSDPKWEAHREL
jgi:hypothetical protein